MKTKAIIVMSTDRMLIGMKAIRRNQGRVRERRAVMAESAASASDSEIPVLKNGAMMEPLRAPPQGRLRLSRPLYLAVKSRRSFH